MVLDTIHIAAGGHAHRVVSLLGHDIILDVPAHTLILAAVGAGFLASYAWTFFRFVTDFVRPGINVKAFQAKDKTTYAIVTGCTGGIGLDFARQLARKGYGLVLVGRRQGALDEVAKELETKYQAPSRTVLADVADAAARRAALDSIRAVLADVDVGVLVNNVGRSHEMPVAFAETEADEIDAIIATNMSWTLHLTRVVLPHLIARSKAKGRTPKSLVLNVGSMSGRIPSALLATYSGTKAGLQTWSRALALELEGTGVVVQTVLPAFVVSNMSKIRKASLLVPSAPAFVRSTLGSLGRARGALFRHYESTPYPSHAVLDLATSAAGKTSEWVAMKVIDSMHVDIRKRALRKKERETKGK
ncbi:hypothetical protein Q5752_001176 [Cryptotrichosporon argae]